MSAIANKNNLCGTVIGQVSITKTAIYIFYKLNMAELPGCLIVRKVHYISPSFRILVIYDLSLSASARAFFLLIKDIRHEVIW